MDVDVETGEGTVSFVTLKHGRLRHQQPYCSPPVFPPPPPLSHLASPLHAMNKNPQQISSRTFRVHTCKWLCLGLPPPPPCLSPCTDLVFHSFRSHVLVCFQHRQTWQNPKSSRKKKNIAQLRTYSCYPMLTRSSYLWQAHICNGAHQESMETIWQQPPAQGQSSMPGLNSVRRMECGHS